MTGAAAAGPDGGADGGAGGAESGVLVGTDVGGTFTDVWVLTPEGRSIVRKTPTTPDVVSGVVEGVTLAARGLGWGIEELCPRIARFGHGTTIGLNALLTGSVPRTAILTTAGFGDTLAIGRLRRGVASLAAGELGDYAKRGRVAPLVPRRLIGEVAERIDRTGRVLAPLDEAAASAEVRRLAALDVEAVAICLLWATENDVHERRLAQIVAAELPRAFTAVSSVVAPAVGEYARMSTTAACAALGPVAGRYLTVLEERLRAYGMTVPVLMTTSAGGLLPGSDVASVAVRGLMSGPASGVMAGRSLGRRTGHGSVLTLDVGGTSFDVGVVVDGEPLLRSGLTVGGADIRVPSIDVASIGAGGGSLASVVRGRLSVGPRSAGAWPGPACYGRGGSEPTATDADLLLGVLDPGRFVGGTFPLDAGAAEKAITQAVAEPLGLDARAAAAAIRDVLDAQMADLLRSVTVERGHDPREFLLVVGGGSGPSHAWSLARELGVSGFAVPATATAQSAFGAGTTRLSTSAERTSYVRIPPGAAVTAGQAATLRAAAGDARRRASDALSVPQAELRITAAVRYRGQAHSLDIALPDDLDLDPTGAAAGSAAGSTTGGPAAVEALLTSFEERYEALFGRGAAYREAGFEILSARAVASAPQPPGDHDGGGGGAGSHGPGAPAPGTGTSGVFAPVGERDVVFDDPSSPVRTPVFETSRPAPDQRLLGPCLVELPGCVIVVPPGAVLTSDTAGVCHVQLRQPS